MSRNHYMLIAICVSISYTPSRSEICGQTVSKNVSMVVSIKVSRQEIYKTVCDSWFMIRLNCTRSRFKYSTGYVIQYQPINETRYVNCKECSDWEFAENLCESCGNCQPCRCNRTNSKSCEKRDGSCNCNRGWQGKTCDDRCKRGTYGENCIQKCQCHVNNTLLCDHHDGGCKCKPGWMGTTCNQACESWYFGDNCSKSCLCDKENTLFCFHDDGTCHCKPGWEGTVCNETDRCSNELTNKTESWPICAKHSDTSRTLNDSAMAGIIVSVLLISAILTIITVCVKMKHLNRRKTARSDDVSYQVTSRQRVYVKGLEDQGQGQDVPYYASVLANPTLEQGRTTAPTEGPYACLEEFQRGTYMTVQKSEEKCSEMDAHYEAVEPVTEVTVLRR